MNYKNHKILATQNATLFYEVDDDGEIGDEVDVNYDSLVDDDILYSVVSDDNWCLQTFETIEQCKLFIDKETKDGLQS